MVTQQDLERINEQTKFTKELAERVMELPIHHLKWDGRMTCSAGSITWKLGLTLIKLSKPIFLRAVENMGADRACEEIHETLLHEYGHLIVGHPGHGRDWAEVVEKLGGHPTKFHNLTAGRQLIPAELRLRFFVSEKVGFSVKGTHYVGKITKHNPKNVRVKVLLPRNDAGKQWNIPWTIANRTMEVVNG